MQTFQVFDPAMCCDTGICGPSVDPKLVRFAADLDWLKGQGVAVERFNLAQQPGAFAADAAVKGALEAKGEDALPLVKVNGNVKSTGTYPTRDELAGWAGIALAAPRPSVYTDAVTALVGLSAAVASSCQACFQVYFDKARQLGVPTEDIVRTVKIAERVKAAPPKRLSELVERCLKADAPEAAPAGDASSHESCC